MPSVAELKTALKSHGMVASGTKGQLQQRLALWNSSRGLTTLDGSDPCALPLGRLKKVAATEGGVSPMGNQDEILTAFVAYLKKNGGGGAGGSGGSSSSGGSSASSSSSSSSSAKGRLDKNAVIAKVLELSDVDDHSAVLSLAGAGGTAITAASSTATMRKAYLKLSLVLHPDRNRDNPDAAKAFQGLARAFERLSNPELFAGEGEDGEGSEEEGEKAAKLSRSNAGCFRTKVECPRCSQKWSESALEVRGGEMARVWYGVVRVVWCVVLCKMCCVKCEVLFRSLSPSHPLTLLTFTPSHLLTFSHLPVRTLLPPLLSHTAL